MTIVSDLLQEAEERCGPSEWGYLAIMDAAADPRAYTAATRLLSDAWEQLEALGVKLPYGGAPDAGMRAQAFRVAISMALSDEAAAGRAGIGGGT